MLLPALRFALRIRSNSSGNVSFTGYVSLPSLPHVPDMIGTCKRLSRSQSTMSGPTPWQPSAPSLTLRFTYQLMDKSVEVEPPGSPMFLIHLYTHATLYGEPRQALQNLAIYDSFVLASNSVKCLATCIFSYNGAISSLRSNCGLPTAYVFPCVRLVCFLGHS